MGVEAESPLRAVTVIHLRTVSVDTGWGGGEGDVHGLG